MEEEKIKRIYEILDNIPVTEKNKSIIEEIKQKKKMMMTMMNM